MLGQKVVDQLLSEGRVGVRSTPPGGGEAAQVRPLPRRLPAIRDRPRSHPEVRPDRATEFLLYAGALDGAATAGERMVIPFLPPRADLGAQYEVSGGGLGRESEVVER